MIFSKLPQFANADEPIVFTLSGILTVVSAVQPLNVLFPIVLNESGSVIVSNAVHPLKVLFRLLNPFPKVTFASLGFPLNWLLSSVTPSPITIVVRLSHP